MVRVFVKELFECYHVYYSFGYIYIIETMSCRFCKKCYTLRYTRSLPLAYTEHDQTSPHNQTLGKGQTLYRNTTGTVTQYTRPDQEPGNLKRKTKTQAGAGQKKSVSHCGYVNIFKYATHYLYISKKNSPEGVLK